MFFCYTFPYTCADIKDMSDTLTEMYKDSNETYFTNEVFTHSLEGRPIELLTLTSKKGITQ